MKRLALLLLAACGDDLRIDDVFEATSGSRLKLSRYRFADGTEQIDPTELFDTQLHATCHAVMWGDGVLRCVPLAEQAVYTDAQCTEVLGQVLSIMKPTHFIGFDIVGDQLLAQRLYVAGTPTDAVFQIYQRRDDACEGPFEGPQNATYVTVGGQVDAAGLVEDEVGTGRLALRTLASDDGMRVAVAVRDRVLDRDCIPEGDACAPTGATLATLYADPDCTQPVVTGGLEQAPAIAEVDDVCPTYHAVGAPVTGQLYRRDRTGCVANGVGVPAFAVGAPLDLAPLTREVVPRPDRRLAPIVLASADGDLRFPADALFDTATRADCRRTAVGDVTRCLPAPLAPATTLFSAGCAMPVPAVELPVHTCGHVAFAIDGDAAVRAIGDAPQDPLFSAVPGGCVPYTAAPETMLRALGPALPPETFEGALHFSDRGDP